VNLFSNRESELPFTSGDQAFARDDSGTGAETGQQKRQYRESTAPLAALALLVLLLETGVFLSRGRP
jgi:hypothetical protein